MIYQSNMIIVIYIIIAISERTKLKFLQILILTNLGEDFFALNLD
ncbi:hypothetical protein CHRY9390_01468 [Chryseobacterium aquaeductus]|uniref:Uncharacterized protein n=1 Tax=Chryseobacterium aquaeductus TaxID=2675056 RepID=A0A9N8MG35_9FLAO|nr:hypothetical protein CHRY9390_01468 [Chryseobacterium potabilaquae]CAD7806135.1 hypothetical protein CHRY9390_01468 [Chryseobacterium aquaeductus]